MDISKFLEYVRLPCTHPRAIHPALLDAICLAACHISGGIAHDFETVFLARTRKHLDQALAFADRLLHFTWASVILCLYYGRSGRMLEMHSTISTAARFAIGLEDLLPGSGGTGDRVCAGLWYVLYILDMNLNSYFDLPMSLSADVSPFLRYF